MEILLIIEYTYVLKLDEIRTYTHTNLANIVIYTLTFAKVSVNSIIAIIIDEIFFDCEIFFISFY